MRALSSRTFATFAFLAFPGAAVQIPGVQPISVREQCESLKTEFEDSQRSFLTLLREAKTVQEKERLWKLSAPRIDGFAEQFRALAKANPMDPAAVDCLAWIVKHAPTAVEKERALSTLLRDHLANPSLGMVCQGLVYLESSQAEQFLRTMSSESPHEEARGLACYSLGQYLVRKGTLARRFKLKEREFESYFSPEFVQELRHGPDGPEREAEKVFEDVVAKYGAIGFRKRRLGEAATGELFELRSLNVGQPAPNIEGEDTDGRRMVLSNYSGKVVFLVFWAFW